MKIKKFISSICLILFSSISYSQEFFIASTNLNVRSGAGLKYPVLFILPKGDEVQILSKENDWYKVKYFDKTGYAHSMYLKYNKPQKNIRNFAKDKSSNVYYIIILVCILFLVYYYLRRNKKNVASNKESNQEYRGTASERELVLTLLRYGIPQHHLFHDLYLKTDNSKFSQIDVVAITNVGIVVFEVKDYSGWIFGSGNQQQWTQVLFYGKQKFRFYNPILQNKKHISELRKQLHFGELPIYSIIVFYGECEIKEINYVPNGTFIVKSNRILDVMNVILSEHKPIQYLYEKEIVQVLENAVYNGGIIDNQRQHAENINDLLGKHRIYD